MKQIFLASAACISLALSAQNENDALRYSNPGMMASARTLGLGGSFSSIGSDPVVPLINPAAIATFRRSEFNLSVQFLNNKSSSTYIDQTSNDYKFSFSLPNINFVFTKLYFDKVGKPAKKGLVNLNYGFHINKLNSFNSRIAFDATNKKSSITDFFAREGNREGGNPDYFEYGYLPYMAYKTQTVVYVNNDHMESAYTDSTRNNTQFGNIDTKGSMWEYQASLGLNISHKFLFGLGLFYTTFRYTESESLKETDLRPINGKPDIESVNYEYHFTDKGTGFGARFGVIFKPNEQIRLAAAIHTPRTFSIRNSFGYDINERQDQGTGSQFLVYHEYNEKDNTFDYKVTTPMKIVTGVGLVINRLAILNADFEFYNYTSARMEALGDKFPDENKNIKTNYRNVINTRLGAEINLPNKNDPDQSFRLRMGLSILPTPYSDKFNTIDDVYKKGNHVITFGGGIKDKDYYVDFGVGIGSSLSYYKPYETGTPYFNSYSISNKFSRINFLCTIGMTFQ